MPVVPPRPLHPRIYSSAFIAASDVPIALSPPLCRRIQEDIRMYSSATAVSDPSLHSGQEVRRPVVLAQFARRSQNATARDETDPSLSLRARLEALLIELERVIQETLQPEEVRVWLRETEIEV